MKEVKSWWNACNFYDTTEMQSSRSFFIALNRNIDESKLKKTREKDQKSKYLIARVMRMKV